MVLKGFLFAVLALCASHVVALSLANSKWIWTDKGFMTVKPGVIADFRRDVFSPFRKVAESAQIIIAADNAYTLYVNGAQIGTGNDWTVSQQYCVQLQPIRNVFAVAVQNGAYSPGDPTPNPAAFIAAIQINFSDGSSETIVTDANWLGHTPVAGFQNPNFNDGSWTKAFVAGSVNSSPWHTPAGPVDASPSTSSLSISGAKWIWTNEVPPNSPQSSAPVGSRAFRKTINVPNGGKVKSGVIIFDADNEYNLYINGNSIGTGNNWQQAQRRSFTLNQATDEVVIAVNAHNDGGPAGIISAIALEVQYRSCSAASFYTTDGTWKFDKVVPPNFQKPNYNDNSWKSAVVEGPYGVAPWGPVPVVNA